MTTPSFNDPIPPLELVPGRSIEAAISAFTACWIPGQEAPASAEAIAAAALAEPVEWPGDGDAHELWALAQLAPGEEITDGVDRIAAFLTRRNTPPQPVAVAERLPGPGDCDVEGRCWWFIAPSSEHILRQSPTWCLGKRNPEDFGIWTHWLPATALRMPDVEVEI
jgi:hypothetical protein